MSTTATKLSTESFLGLIGQSRLIDPDHLRKAMKEFQEAGVDVSDPRAIADQFISKNVLTRWQADKLLQGKHKGFFLGKYRLLSLLGTGGMSSVYLAEHVLMRRRVAVKILPQQRVDDSSYLKRFHREAQAVAALDHRNIVRAYDVDVDGRNHFLVMEFVPGKNLQELVQRDGPLSYARAAEYMRQAAEGLGHAHKAGLVHRDIKPGNLLLDEKGVVKLLDLGLARFFAEGDENSLTIRHDEKVLGTADYLSPEQARDSHNVDIRSDLYSLGCTLYFTLTGHPPFPEGTMAMRLLAHQQKEPTPIVDERPDVPPGLIDVCGKMMAKTVEDRYQTARETAQALQDWLVAGGGAEWAAMNPVIGGSSAVLASKSGTRTDAGGLRHGGSVSSMPAPATVVESGVLGPERPVDANMAALFASLEAQAPVVSPPKPAGKSDVLKVKPPDGKPKPDAKAHPPAEPDSDVKAETEIKPSPDVTRKFTGAVPTPGAENDAGLSEFFSNLTGQDPRPPGRKSAATLPIPHPPAPVASPAASLPESPALPAASPPRHEDADLASPPPRKAVPVSTNVKATPAAPVAAPLDAGGFPDFSAFDAAAARPVPAKPAGLKTAAPVAVAHPAHRGGNPVATAVPVPQAAVAQAAPPVSRRPAGNKPGWVLIGGIAVAVLVVAGLAYMAFGPKGDPDGKTADSGKPTQKPKSPRPSRGSARKYQTLNVGTGLTYRSIGAALDFAKDNYSSEYHARITIEVAPGAYPERITLDKSFHHGIEIVSASKDQPVILNPPGTEPIVVLKDKYRAFRLENVTIEAKDRGVAVQIAGEIEDCVFKNVTINGFTAVGVSCDGAFPLGDPNLFDTVTFRSGGAAAVGIRFDQDKDIESARLTVRNSRFIGPLAIGIEFGTAQDVLVANTIFADTTTGVRFRGKEKRWVDVVFSHNTFFRNDRGIVFDEMPGSGSNSLGFYNNLFLQLKGTAVVVASDYKEIEFNSMMSKGPGSGVFANWTDTPLPPTPPADAVRVFEAGGGKAGVQDLQFVSLDPASGDFLVPASGSPLGGQQSFDAFGPFIGARAPK